MESKNSNNLCRLCVQENCGNMINVFGKVEIDDRPSGFSLEFLILYCLDIHLNNDDPTTTKDVCLDCVERLKFVFCFKEICRQNNETNFGLKSAPSKISDVNTNKTMDMSNIIVKEEPIFYSPVTEHDESNLLVEVKAEPNDDSGLFDMRLEENRKNAQRQKDKRAHETPEEREIRRKKASEQARARRHRKRKENPEEYKRILARAAELKRLRRKGLCDLNYEDKNNYEINMKLEAEREPATAGYIEETQAALKRSWKILTAEELDVQKKRNAEKARLNRQKLKLENPDKYAMQLAREAELKRIRRKALRLSMSDSSNGLQGEIQSESQSESVNDTFQEKLERERTLTPDELVKVNMQAFGTQLIEQQVKSNSLTANDLIKLNMQAYETQIAQQVKWKKATQEQLHLTPEEFNRRNMEQFERHFELAQSGEFERIQRQNLGVNHSQPPVTTFNDSSSHNSNAEILEFHGNSYTSSFKSWSSHSLYNES